MDKFAKAIFVLLMLAAGAAGAVTTTFTANGNWTAPAGVTSVTVEAWGGGGGGGGATGNPAKGGGGAGGQYARMVVTVVPGNTYAIAVGAGGTSSATAAGVAGGNSTFAATTVVARGGAGGALCNTNSCTAAGGAGSTASGVGDQVYAGGNGSNGSGATGVGGAGGGGAGSNGAGGNATGNTAGTGTATGGGNGAAARTSGGACTNAASVAGGGGCGGYATGNTDRSGSAGARGQVVLTYVTAPSATTSAASSITTTSAQLNGTVSSNGASTTVMFDYGLDTTYDNTVTAAQSPLAANASNTAVSASITGLTCNTTYYYRVRATNSAGTTSGADSTFTTSACIVCNPPSNIPANVTVSCQCDNFTRATLNPSDIFGANWTVSTSDTTGILPSIVNSGYLRLTNNTGNNAKAATVPGIFPAAGNYISVEFRQYAYNGSGADGIAVTLSDYSVPAVPGAFGGSLGYAQRTGVDGFAGGWLGVALDEYGNYQNPTEGRLGGPGFRVDSVGARGSGSGMNGYRWLGGTATLSPGIDNRTSTTPSLGHYYQVIVDARNEPTSTAVAVNRDTTGTGNSYASLISIPNVYTAAAAQGFTQAPVPTNWQISFTGSTGGSTNIHEIGSLRVCAQYMDPPSGGTADGFNAIDEAYGTPPLAVQNYLNGHIYTKLVGTPFRLNVAALADNQIVTTYALGSSKTVTVKLVDNSDSLANAALDCTLSCTGTCTSKAAVAGGTQTITFASGAPDKGQKQSPNFTINTAYSKLVAIISDGTTNACSTDSFAVRPASIAAVASSNATNTGTSGLPIFKAGSDNFALTATTTGISGNPSGYTGVVKINNNIVQVAGPATVKGTVSGTFPAATSATPASTATGAAFTYSEVGAFTLPGYNPATDTTSRRSVYDGVSTPDECTTPGLTTAQCDALRAATWTGVDSISAKNDCVLDSYSNVRDVTGNLSSNPNYGKFGCNFGLLANAVVFGRFVPDHFDTVMTLVSGVPMGCPDGQTCPVLYDGFVYSGQPFSLSLTARNAGGNPTLNYNTTTGLSKSVTLSAWNAIGATGVANQNPGGGTLSSNNVPSTAFVAGVGTTTNTPIYTFPTVAVAPADIYIRATDTDNVTSLRAVSSIEGGVRVVSGRIKVSNAYGSEWQQLQISATAQYWDGNNWLISATDDVTTFSTAANLSKTNLTGLLGAGNINAVGAGNLTMADGVTSFTLAASGVTGSADIGLSAPGYLLTGSNGAGVDPSIPGRVTFGVYKNNNRFIYRREN